MPHTRYTPAEIVRLGKALYDQRIRSHVEPVHNGKLMALDIDSGDYEIDEIAALASERLRSRRPDASVFILRVGAPAAFKLGARR